MCRNINRSNSFNSITYTNYLKKNCFYSLAFIRLNVCLQFYFQEAFILDVKCLAQGQGKSGLPWEVNWKSPVDE